MATTSCGRSRRHALLLATTVLMSGLAAPALAQSVGSIAPPPVRMPVDENGVDLATSLLVVDGPSLALGASENPGIAYARENGAPNYSIMITNNGTNTVAVVLGGKSRLFSNYGGVYTSLQGEGETLTATSTTFTYKSDEGTIITFNRGAENDYLSPDAGGAALATSIVEPDGTKTVLSYSETTADVFLTPAQEPQQVPLIRLSTVDKSNGYQLKYEYAANYTTYGGTREDLAPWFTLTKVTAVNRAADYLTQTWPSFTYSQSYSGQNLINTVTDQSGRTTHYTRNGSNVIAIKRPGSSVDDVTISYSGGLVSSVTKRGQTTTYSYSLADSIRTTTRTNALSQQRITTAYTSGLILTDTDPLNRKTTQEYDSFGRVTKIIPPEGSATGGYTQFTYDGRGNVIQTLHKAKDGSGLADIVTSATYPATCANVLACNKPLTTTDAKGNVTDYTYDPAHGGVLTVTSPAATPGGIRPQVRMTYATAQAYYKNSSGSIVASGQNQYLLTGTSICQTTASCAGTADEIKTTIGYGPQVAGTANNLLPVSVSRGSGDGSLTSTTTVAYDGIGNVVSVDGPLAGNADTTRTIYDAARQPVGVIGPDPDGAGALPNRAQRMTYNADGQVTKVERGTTAGQSDSAWASFSAAETVTSTYDANARKTTDSIAAGGTNYALTQYSYDGLGRPHCTALRMNPAAFGSLPGSVCSLGTEGSFGPDRISVPYYDAASQVTGVLKAFGTPDQAWDSYYSYTPNGKVQYLIDGNNNYTAYTYDGFDRVARVTFPSKTTPGDLDLTNYETYTYDANSNVTQRRLRDGQTISYTYDTLNRMIAKDRPNGTSWDTDYTYTYDLLGRMTTVTHGNSYGLAYSFGYDALGRKTNETNNGWFNGNLAYVYDLAGRRTRTTWNDGLYIDYDRLVTGEVSAIRESSATSGVGVLGTYAYDSLGRMTTLIRGNGVVTSYGYDAVSRLSSLAHNLASTANDVTTTFSYNPAGQIASSTRDNDTYAWNGHSNRDLTETPNGLNQLVSQGSTSFGYDSKGNLNSASGISYTYSSENELTTSSGGTYNYNPFGLLFNENISGGTNVTFQYDGVQIATESSAATATTYRRYVYGLGTDDPLVWYEGSGTSDRRWLITDERGSVVAVTDASGTATAINRYDEYGVPATTNAGRFGYTGQTWLPELGVWNYKARIYNPALGRFMQSDPIGYGGGMNMYNYVGSDPVNGRDPSGLLDDCRTVVHHCTGPGYIASIFDGDIIANGYRDLGSVIGPLQLQNLGVSNFNFTSISAGGYDDTITVSARQAKPQQSRPSVGAAKPAYCSGFIYRFGNAADQFGGVGKKLAVGGVAGGLLAAWTGAGLGFAAGSVRAYGYASELQVTGELLKGFGSGKYPVSSLLTYGLVKALTPPMQLGRTSNGLVDISTDAIFGNTLPKPEDGC